MSTDHVLLTLVGRRILAGGRVLLGCAWLALTLTRVDQTEIPIAVAGLYLAYAATMVFLRTLQRPGFALFHLLLDACLLPVALVTVGPVLWFGGLWFLYLTICTVLLHRWRQNVVITAGCVAFLGMVQPPGWEPLAMMWLLLGALAQAALWHKHEIEERLYSISRQAVLFRSDAQKARDDERERIAADFHDGPLQVFMSLQMRLEVARRLLEKNTQAGVKELAEMAELWRSQVVDLRSFLRSMRASDIDATELFANLSRLAESFQKESGAPTTFSATGEVELQQPGLAVEIVQIVREALHNTRKHARATHVSVHVAGSAGELDITIDDNGEGFPFSGSYNLDELDLLRMGPGSIKRRVRSLGGEMTIESKPGRGSSLRIVIPQ